MKKCPCGKELHYSSPEIQKLMEDFCDRLGEYINVTVEETGKTYKISRHFIALHGVKAKNIHLYGFEEVQNE